MANTIAIIIGSITTSVTMLCALLVAIGKARSATYELMRGARARVKIIGIPTGVVVPSALAGLPAFNDYKAAVFSNAPTVLLHTTTLSRALRLCDWVIVDPKADVKIILPGTHPGDSLLNSLSGQTRIS